MEINVKKIVMFEGGVETLAYFSKQMAEQFSVQMADSFEKVITPTFQKMKREVPKG